MIKVSKPNRRTRFIFSPLKCLKLPKETIVTKNLFKRFRGMGQNAAAGAFQMKNLPVRAALAFTVPVLLVFVYWAWHQQSDYFLLAGPLCGIIGGLAFG